jgi:lysozyme
VACWPGPDVEEVGPVTVSEKGLEFIARFEGYRRYVYDDGAGWATIGIGHLLGPWSRRAVYRAMYPLGWSYKRSLRQLRTDAAKADLAVTEYARPLPQNGHDALCSFAFNCGTGALMHSSLLKDVNRKAAAGTIEADFERWNHAGGIVLPGLTTRRKAEARLYLTGMYR